MVEHPVGIGEVGSSILPVGSKERISKMLQYTGKFATCQVMIDEIEEAIADTVEIVHVVKPVYNFKAE